MDILGLVKVIRFYRISGLVKRYQAFLLATASNNTQCSQTQNDHGYRLGNQFSQYDDVVDLAVVMCPSSMKNSKPDAVFVFGQRHLRRRPTSGMRGVVNRGEIIISPGHRVTMVATEIFIQEVTITFPIAGQVEIVQHTITIVGGLAGV